MSGFFHTGPSVAAGACPKVVGSAFTHNWRRRARDAGRWKRGYVARVAGRPVEQHWGEARLDGSAAGVAARLIGRLRQPARGGGEIVVRPPQNFDFFRPENDVEVYWRDHKVSKGISRTQKKSETSLLDLIA